MPTCIALHYKIECCWCCTAASTDCLYGRASHEPLIKSHDRSMHCAAPCCCLSIVQLLQHAAGTAMRYMPTGTTQTRGIWRQHADACPMHVNMGASGALLAPASRQASQHGLLHTRGTQYADMPQHASCPGSSCAALHSLLPAAYHRVTRADHASDARTHAKLACMLACMHVPCKLSQAGLPHTGCPVHAPPSRGAPGAS
jgi:hypothetical protein